MRDKQLTLYHGTNHEIPRPEYGEGKQNNDYGRGFYCTQNFEKAAAWAMRDISSPIVNEYSLDAGELKVFNFAELKTNILLHWAAVVIHNRSFKLGQQIEINNYNFLEKFFYIDLSNYDIIKGYRADDRYFRYAKDFLRNSITIAELGNAMFAGNLGTQTVLTSQRAFSQISFIKSHLITKRDKFESYDSIARKTAEEYEQMQKRKLASELSPSSVPMVLSNIVFLHNAKPDTDFDNFANRGKHEPSIRFLFSE